MKSVRETMADAVGDSAGLMRRLALSALIGAVAPGRGRRRSFGAKPNPKLSRTAADVAERRAKHAAKLVRRARLREGVWTPFR